MEDHALQAELSAVTSSQTGLQVSDSVSSMMSLVPKATPAVRRESQDEDRQAPGHLQLSSAQTGRKGVTSQASFSSQASSSSQGSDRPRRRTTRGEAQRGLHRCVCSMYQLPPYLHSDHCCAASLGVANSIMQACTLPGLEHGSFITVSANSLLFHLGVSWGFTAMTIALGSSYFQRLCHTVPSMQWAAQRHANFAAYAVPRLTGGDDDDDLGPGYEHSPQYLSQEMSLQSVLFTCVSIASKNLDRLQHPGILQYMLSKIYGVPVTAEYVYDVEDKCLDGLHWRLGPYFCDDPLESTWVTWIAE